MLPPSINDSHLFLRAPGTCFLPAISENQTQSSHPWFEVAARTSMEVDMRTKRYDSGKRATIPADLVLHNRCGLA